MSLSPGRRAVALTWTALIASTSGAAIVGVIARAAGWIPDPILVGLVAPAALLALAILTGAVRAIAARLPTALDDIFAHRPVAAALWCVLAVAAVANTARLGVFMVDRSQTWASMFPPVEDLARHECLPAYVRAGELAADGQDDLWRRADYEPDAAGTPPPTAIRGMTPRLEDAYEYPPPFAAAARAAVAVTDDYEVLRSGWFGISAAVFLLTVLLVGTWLDGRAGATALLLAPALAMSTPVMISWQFGQAHLVVVAAAVAALVCFERRRHLAGGALLGFAIAVKMFPALLLLVLAMQRRWRAVAATLAAVLALFALALLVLGWGTLSSFVTDHLPAVASGRAFPNAVGNNDNQSFFGLALKVSRLFGREDVTTASRVAWLYGLGAAALVAWSARRSRDRAHLALLWLGTLELATLRSPFAPTYTAVTVLWLLTIASGVSRRRALTTAAIAIAWILLQGQPPLFGARGDLLVSLIPQLIAIGTAIVATGLAPPTTRTAAC